MQLRLFFLDLASVQLILRCSLLCCAALSFGCSFSLPGIYTQNITQGNVVDSEQVKRLELGMDADQVLFLLGTPLLRDSFNPERWDYVQLESESSGAVVERKLGYLLFTDGKLSAIAMSDFIDG